VLAIRQEIKTNSHFKELMGMPFFRNQMECFSICCRLFTRSFPSDFETSGKYLDSDVKLKIVNLKFIIAAICTNK
jgi:hypothetical protein